MITRGKKMIPRKKTKMITMKDSFTLRNNKTVRIWSQFDPGFGGINLPKHRKPGCLQLLKFFLWMAISILIYPTFILHHPPIISHLYRTYHNSDVPKPQYSLLFHIALCQSHSTLCLFTMHCQSHNTLCLFTLHCAKTIVLLPFLPCGVPKP